MVADALQAVEGIEVVSVGDQARCEPLLHPL
jgi:hypothetical protein